MSSLSTSSRYHHRPSSSPSSYQNHPNIPVTEPTFKPRDYSEVLLNKNIHCTMKHVEVDRGSKLQYVWDSFNNFLHLHLVMLFSPVIKPAWPKFSYHQWFIRLQYEQRETRQRGKIRSKNQKLNRLKKVQQRKKGCCTGIGTYNAPALCKWNQL